MGYDPLLIKERQYTVPAVINEIKFKTSHQIRLKVAVEAGKISVIDPAPTALKKVEESACKVGDSFNLSKADKEILALSLELKQNGLLPIIVSDDYTVQNVAEFLGLTYTSLTTLGIRYRFKWILYCTACRRNYPTSIPDKVCQVCGSPLKRRVLRKTPIKRRVDSPNHPLEMGSSKINPSKILKDQ